MKSKSRAATTEVRPRRGNPDETRQRLVAAAAEEFNRAGYHGTDSNRLARAAGYAPGTFYKHFADKRELLLAAYESWVTTEWAAVGEMLAQGGKREDVARRLVEMVLRLHRRWRGLRASLRALIADDPEARAFYRKQRRRQLDLLASMRRGRTTKRTREDDAVFLYTLERVADAVADGELRDLGLGLEPTIERLVELVLPLLE